MVAQLSEGCNWLRSTALDKQAMRVIEHPVAKQTRDDI